MAQRVAAGARDAASTMEPVAASLQAILDQPAANAAHPTMASAAVVANGAVVCSASAGADGATVFLTASISKTFLAALALQCVERGELELDADTALHLPEPVRNPHFPDVPITARQLLQHRASLADDEAYLEKGSLGRWPAGSAAAFGLDEYAKRRLGSKELWSQRAAPGEADYHYSNAGFTLLGLLVQRAAGVPLGRLGRERLFHPLGMLSTGYYLADLADRPGLEFAEPQGQPEGGHYEVAEFPAAQVRSTALDLCKWLVFLTAPRSQPEPEQPVLTRASIDEMLPSSFERSLAWWGLDAAYGEGVPGVYTHGGFMEVGDQARFRDLASPLAPAFRPFCCRWVSLGCFWTHLWWKSAHAGGENAHLPVAGNDRR